MEKAFKHELEIVATPFRSLVEKIAKESWKTHNPAATRNIVQVSLQFCFYYLVLHETRVKGRVLQCGYSSRTTVEEN